MVRATVDFSTIVPMTGIISKIRSQHVSPRPVAVEQLDEDPDEQRRQEDDIEILDQEVAGLDQEDRHLGQRDAEIFEDRLELGDDEVEDEADDHAGDEDDHDRVDHGRLDPPLERLGLLLEVGQALEDRFEGTAGLARLDHVAVEPVERLGMLGRTLRRASGRSRCPRSRPAASS